MLNFLVQSCNIDYRGKWSLFLHLKISSVGPLLDQNLVVRSQRCESERRKEANIPWVMQPASSLQGISQK